MPVIGVRGSPPSSDNESDSDFEGDRKRVARPKKREAQRIIVIEGHQQAKTAIILGLAMSALTFFLGYYLGSKR